MVILRWRQRKNASSGYEQQGKEIHRKFNVKNKVKEM
jgi:hypothetical protein